MIIISNNLSGLWGLFSGPIIGIPITFITQSQFKNEFNGLKDNISDDLYLQSNIFESSIINYDNQNLDEIIKNQEILLIGDNFTSYQPNYTIKTSNFIEETSQLSQIIGKVYNENPNNPPLTSVPHSTTTVSNKL